MSYKIVPFIVALLAFSCSSSTGTDDSSIPSNEEIAHAALEEKCPEKPLNVAIIIADGVFNTELTAPMDLSTPIALYSATCQTLQTLQMVQMVQIAPTSPSLNLMSTV